MPISLFCPVCNVKVEVPERLAGKSAPCPSCGNVIDVPRGGRPSGASRLARRLKAAAPVLVSALALIAAAVAWIQVAGLRSERKGLKDDLSRLQERVAAMEPAAARAPAERIENPPAPVSSAVSADDHAALRRELGALRAAHDSLLRKVEDLEAELARPGEEPPPAVPAPSPVPAPAPPALANDEDITINMKGELDALSPRPRFVFVGTVANAGIRNAPVVQISIRVTGFHGLDPVNRQLVTSVSYAATLTERVVSLPAGTRAQVLKDLFPTVPALITREVFWDPQFEVSARVLPE